MEGNEAAPGEVESLTLHALTLDVAGATLTGEGDFTFDATDTRALAARLRPRARSTCGWWEAMACWTS